MCAALIWRVLCTYIWDDELRKQQQWQQLSSVRSPSSHTRVSKTYRNCFDVRLRPLVAAADSLKLSEISTAVVCTSNFQPFSKINHWICDDFFLRLLLVSAAGRRRDFLMRKEINFSSIFCVVFCSFVFCPLESRTSERHNVIIINCAGLVV